MLDRNRPLLTEEPELGYIYTFVAIMAQAAQTRATMEKQYGDYDQVNYYHGQRDLAWSICNLLEGNPAAYNEHVACDAEELYKNWLELRGEL